MAINISHLRRLKRFPWISFLGSGVIEWAMTMFRPGGRAIYFGFDEP